MSINSIRLAFVGDIMLGRHIDRRLPLTQPDALWGNVLPVLRAADGVIGNLECPITTHPHAWRRTWKPFRFKTQPLALAVLQAANVRMVNIANNHMLDYQAEGLADTMTHLDSAGIGHAGAGRNAYEAARPAITTIAGVKVGMIGLTDNMPKWSAGHAEAGTNYIRVRNDNVTLGLLRALIAQARCAGAEIVIVSCHWGPNFRTSPPAHFRAFARNAIELGANVVHGHSAHLVQGIELHQGGLILYDTGDILDDFWVFPGIRIDHSFVFTAEFNAGRFTHLALRPVVQARTSVRLAEGATAAAICQRMIRRCEPFGTILRPCSDGLEMAASDLVTPAITVSPANVLLQSAGAGT